MKFFLKLKTFITYFCLRIVTWNLLAMWLREYNLFVCIEFLIYIFLYSSWQDCWGLKPAKTPSYGHISMSELTSWWNHTSTRWPSSPSTYRNWGISWPCAASKTKASWSCLSWGRRIKPWATSCRQIPTLSLTRGFRRRYCGWCTTPELRIRLVASSLRELMEI